MGTRVADGWHETYMLVRYAICYYYLLPLFTALLVFLLFFPPWHADTRPAWFYVRVVVVAVFVYMYLAWNTL